MFRLIFIQVIFNRVMRGLFKIVMVRVIVIIRIVSITI